MTRSVWLVCILGVVACGKSDKKAEPKSDPPGEPAPAASGEGTPLPDCIETQTPTKAQAWAAYQKGGGDYEREDAVRLDPSPRTSSAYELHYSEGSLDAPQGLLGIAFMCRFYTEKRDAARGILRFWGWDDSDAETRRKQAAMIDEEFFGGVVTARPTDWDPAHTWKEPETATLPDGGVKRSRWLLSFEHVYGGGIPVYGLVETVIGADGTVGAPEHLGGFKVEPKPGPAPAPEHATVGGGVPLPGCDPAGAPTREQAILAYKSTGGDKPESYILMFPLDRMKGAYTLFQDGGSADAPSYDLGVVWRCQLHPDARSAARVVLLDLGWDKADPAGRVALASQVDDGLLVSVHHKQPDPWDAKHEFKAPETKSLPDGGVQRTRWSETSRHIYGGGIPVFSYDRITFAADGRVGASEHLDGFELTE